MPAWHASTIIAFEIPAHSRSRDELTTPPRCYGKKISFSADFRAVPLQPLHFAALTRASRLAVSKSEPLPLL